MGNAENWKIAVSSMEKQFKNAMDLTYSTTGRGKVEQCKRQAFTIKVNLPNSNDLTFFNMKSRVRVAVTVRKRQTQTERVEISFKLKIN